MTNSSYQTPLPVAVSTRIELSSNIEVVNGQQPGL